MNQARERCGQGLQPRPTLLIKSRDPTPNIAKTAAQYPQCFGPMTPKTIDPRLLRSYTTDARSEALRCFGRSDRRVQRQLDGNRLCSSGCLSSGAKMPARQAGVERYAGNPRGSSPIYRITMATCPSETPVSRRGLFPARPEAGSRAIRCAYEILRNYSALGTLVRDVTRQSHQARSVFFALSVFDLAARHW
jgi:hypothetical protein